MLLLTPDGDGDAAFDCRAGVAEEEEGGGEATLRASKLAGVAAGTDKVGASA